MKGPCSPIYAQLEYWIQGFELPHYIPPLPKSLSPNDFKNPCSMSVFKMDTQEATAYAPYPYPYHEPEIDKFIIGSRELVF